MGIEASPCPAARRSVASGRKTKSATGKAGSLFQKAENPAPGQITICIAGSLQSLGPAALSGIIYTTTGVGPVRTLCAAVVWEVCTGVLGNDASDTRQL
jgi:hypothetical protein